MKTLRVQSAGKLPAVLILAFIFSVTGLPAGAKRKPLKPLVTQKPKFDTSYLPKKSRFEISVKHTDIIYPQDPALLLHGTGKVVTLRAEEKGNLLRGKVSDDQPASAISTLEHGIKPKFSLDYHKLAATIAPDIDHQMQAEIAAARAKSHDVAFQSKLMERELQNRPLRPQMPKVAAQASATIATTKALELELSQSKQRKYEVSKQASDIMAAALAHIGGAGEKMPGIPERLRGLRINDKPTSIAIRMPSSEHVDVNAAARQMNGELEAARRHVPTSADMDAQLAVATKLSHATITGAQSDMDMILTHLRKIPPMSIPTASNKDGMQQDKYDVIKWDAWHAQFAALSKKPILNYMKKANNPSGSNTVEITVLPNHHLTARVSKSANPTFDQAIVQAYQSLDGNADLEFPQGSRRASITFQIDNEHKSPGVPLGVNSQTSVGDQEVMRSR